jgi:hypothetical protein
MYFVSKAEGTICTTSNRETIMVISVLTLTHLSGRREIQVSNAISAASHLKVDRRDTRPSFDASQWEAVKQWHSRRVAAPQI